MQHFCGLSKAVGSSMVGTVGLCRYIYMEIGSDLVSRNWSWKLSLYICAFTAKFENNAIDIYGVCVSDICGITIIKPGIMRFSMRYCALRNVNVSV